MEDRFKLLVVDETTLERHVGEECDLYKEVCLSPTKFQISEYVLFFRGIIRSAWHDVSQNITITCDTEDVYRVIFEDLKEKMETEENITYVVN